MTTSDETQGPSPQRVWIELVVVALLLVAPYICASVSFLIAPTPAAPQSVGSQIGTLLYNLGVIGLLIYLVRSQGQSLQVVGLRPTRWWKEIVWGALILWGSWWSYLYAFPVSALLGWERRGLPHPVLGASRAARQDPCAEGRQLLSA